MRVIGRIAGELLGVFSSGVLGFFAGLLNFGIIPAVGARCLVYFLGLPETITAFSVTMPTFIPLMALLLSITTFVAMSGGLITVMVINKTLSGYTPLQLNVTNFASSGIAQAWHPRFDKDASHRWLRQTVRKALTVRPEQVPRAGHAVPGR